MNKYLHPGYFFLGSHRSTHDWSQKSFMFFQVRHLSGRLVGQGQMHECRRRQNAPTSHPAGASVARVTPRQLRCGAWISDAWKVVQMKSSLLIRIISICCVSTWATAEPNVAEIQNDLILESREVINISTLGRAGGPSTGRVGVGVGVGSTWPVDPKSVVRVYVCDCVHCMHCHDCAVSECYMQEHDLCAWCVCNALPADAIIFYTFGLAAFIDKNRDCQAEWITSQDPIYTFIWRIGMGLNNSKYYNYTPLPGHLQSHRRWAGLVSSEFGNEGQVGGSNHRFTEFFQNSCHKNISW
jgi:hypothetical protein